jgi:hypothetical protein
MSLEEMGWLEPTVAVTIRLLVPFTIFRWPLWGLIASAMADMFDVVIAGAIGRGEFPNYAAADKLMDTYYLTFALIITRRWDNTLTKRTSVFLYLHRLTGVVLFELTGVRVLLLIFPNLFESFVVFYLVVQRFFPKFSLQTYSRLAVVLVLLLIPKLPQEYMLHYAEFGPWNWFHTQVLGIEAKEE